MYMQVVLRRFLRLRVKQLEIALCGVCISGEGFLSRTVAVSENDVIFYLTYATFLDLGELTI